MPRRGLNIFSGLNFPGWKHAFSLAMSGTEARLYVYFMRKKGQSFTWLKSTDFSYRDLKTTMSGESDEERDGEGAQEQGSLMLDELPDADQGN